MPKPSKLKQPYCSYKHRGKGYCNLRAKYWVWGKARINKYLCGFHAKKYLKENTAAYIAYKLTKSKEKPLPLWIKFYQNNEWILWEPNQEGTERLMSKTRIMI